MAQAQSDVITAQNNLNAAIGSYINNIVALEGQLEGQLTQHQTDFDNNSGLVVDGFELAVEGIELSMNGVLDPIEQQFDDDVEQIDTDLQDNLDDALEQFTTDSQNEQNLLTADLQGIESSLDSAVILADGNLTTTNTNKSGILNGVIAAEESGFDGDVTAQQQSFTNTVLSKQGTFDTAETSNFNSYEAAVGDDTTGFMGSYKSFITGFENLRDATLANYPNTTYDPSVLDPTDVQTVVNNAQSSFENNIQPLIDNYELHVGTLQTNYNTAVSNAYGDYADDMIVATDTRNDKYLLANQNYDDTMAGPRTTYTQQMANILGVFNDAMLDASNQRTYAYQAAQGIYDSIVNPATENAEDLIEAANQEYDDWLNGVGVNAVTSATWTRTQTVDNSTSPPTTTWAASGFLQTAAGSTPWAGGGSSKMPEPPEGYVFQGPPVVTIAGSITTTVETFVNNSPTAPDPSTGIRANPYELALLARFNAYANQLDGLSDAYDLAVNDANTAKADAIEDADELYLTTVYGNPQGIAPFDPSSPAGMFNSAMAQAQQNFDTTEGPEWTTYTDDVAGYYNDLMTQMMDAMMNGTPMPTFDPAIVGGFAQTYLVNSLNAAIDYTEAVGAAWVAFVGQERAADSIRDQGHVQAEYDCAVATENAANTADQGAISAWSDFAQDALGINADYTIAKAGKDHTRQLAILNANTGLALTANGAAETKTHSEALADKNYADDEAQNWDDRRQDEADAEHALSLAENGAEETRIKDIGVADADFAVDEADAANERDKKINQAEVDLATGVAGEEATLTTGVLGFVPQMMTTIANGIDSLYTSYHTGNADQAAVSNAWTQFTTQAAGVWASFAGQEAGVWLGYQIQTILDWQTMADDIADAAQSMIDNLAPEYTTMIDNIAGALRTYWDDMADALKLRNQTVSTAVLSHTQQANAEILSSENTIIGFARTHDDGVIGDIQSALSNYLGNQKQFVTDIVNNALPFEQSIIGAVGGVLGALRSLIHTQVADDLASYLTIFQVATGTDDGIYTAWADRETKQALLSTVIARDLGTSVSAAQFFTMLPGRIGTFFYPYFTQSDSAYSFIRDGLVSQYLSPATNAVGGSVVPQQVAALQIAPAQPQQQTQQNTSNTIGSSGRLQNAVNGTGSMLFIQAGKAEIDRSKWNTVNPASKGFFLWMTGAGIYSLIDTVPVAIMTGGQESAYKIALKAETTSNPVEATLLYGVGIPMTGVAVLTSYGAYTESTGAILIEAVPLRLKNWYMQGAEKDAEWRSLSLRDKAYFEVGQQTRSLEVYRQFEHLDEVNRGRALIQYYGGGVGGWYRALRPEGSGWYLGAGETLGTGPTPLLRYIGSGGLYGGQGVLFMNQSNPEQWLDRRRLGATE